MSFCPTTRPYKTTEEMNKHLIESWNSVVTKEDVVYHLGDFAFTKNPRELNEFFYALNGEKHLVVGNHDGSAILNLPWKSVSDYKLLMHNNQKVVLFHYPIMAGQWDAAHHGSILVHSHVHGAPQYKEPVRAIDVGVDAIGPVPISIDQVVERMNKIPVKKLRKNDQAVQA
jgi:calcineurin-like phosphoesterase family protein